MSDAKQSGEINRPPPEWVGGDPKEYGKQLLDWLLDDKEVRSRWDTWRGATESTHRIQLEIEPEDANELHAAVWESLYADPEKGGNGYLATDTDTPFSRSIASPHTTRGPVSLDELKVLVVIPNPPGLGEEGEDWQSFAPVNPEVEEEALKRVSGNAPVELVRLHSSKSLQMTGMLRPSGLQL